MSEPWMPSEEEWALVLPWEKLTASEAKSIRSLVRRAAARRAAEELKEVAKASFVHERLAALREEAES